MDRKAKLVLLGAAVVAILGVWAWMEFARPLSAQGTPGGLVVGHQVATVGTTVSVATALQSLPDGLAGFTVDLRTTNPSVAAIEGVIVDAMFAFEGLDSAGFKMTVVDLAGAGGFWQPGAGFSPLFDVTLNALTPGQTTLEVEMLKMDAEDGTPMATSSAGILIVVQ